MQPKPSPLILATAALGVLALGGLAYVFLAPGGSAPAQNQVAAAPTPTPLPSMVWVAARDIPPRTRVTSAMLSRVSYTGKGPVPEGSIQDMSQLSDEITSEPILRGQPIVLTSFNAGVKRKVPADIEIPAGFRAVAIYVNPTETAAGLIDVGDYVDVISVHKLSLDKEKNQAVVGALQFSAGRLIATDLKVLAVGDPAPAATPTPVPAPNGAAPAADTTLPPTPTPPPAAKPDSGAPQSVRVLLAAPVEIATRLVAAGDQGVLHVTIRNPSDGDNTASPEAREYPSRLVTQKEVTAAAKDIGKAYGDGLKSSLGPPMPMPLVPVPTLAPALPMPMPSTVPTPEGPPTADVTVIRGTEKMRVVVPQR